MYVCYLSKKDRYSTLFPPPESVYVWLKRDSDKQSAVKFMQIFQKVGLVCLRGGRRAVQNCFIARAERYKASLHPAIELFLLLEGKIKRPV